MEEKNSGDSEEAGGVCSGKVVSRSIHVEAGGILGGEEIKLRAGKQPVSRNARNEEIENLL
jgi:hypothetical protein